MPLSLRPMRPSNYDRVSVVRDGRITSVRDSPRRDGLNIQLSTSGAKTSSSHSVQFGPSPAFDLERGGDKEEEERLSTDVPFIHG
eukprot:CAMPEP_0184681184 /NCGR_PEP_ID=MMETSP0312-20130426/4138_1 /TAXON_ID=31354 /ORGANISM="Compsopogon coeruleus, Strain SAG 36.94" /LENGTH=84 /DNA_ID=CAMNT_0027131845 /DNA_START=1943 /DNA_END=2198 /DNA_ORIENTATION=+